jgi:hypothetical protein
MWRGKLRNNYSSFGEWKEYSDIYGLAKRIGFESALAAWDTNPTIQGSVNPEDFKIIKSTKQKLGIMLAIGCACVFLYYWTIFAVATLHHIFQTGP